MNKIILFASIVFSTVALAADPSFDGLVVRCNDKVMQYDLYWIKALEKETDLGDKINHKEILEDLFKKNELFQFQRIKVARNAVSFFESHKKVLNDISLPVPKSGLRALPDACQYERAIFQMREQDVTYGPARFIVDGDIWEELDEQNKAALLFNELLAFEPMNHGFIPPLSGLSLLTTSGLLKEKTFKNFVLGNVGFSPTLFDMGSVYFLSERSPNYPAVSGEAQLNGNIITLSKWSQKHIYGKKNESIEPGVEYKFCQIIEAYWVPDNPVQTIDLNDITLDYEKLVPKDPDYCDYLKENDLVVESTIEPFAVNMRSIDGKNLKVTYLDKIFFVDVKTKIEDYYYGKHDTFHEKFFYIYDGKVAGPPGNVYEGEFLFNLSSGKIEIYSSFRLTKEAPIEYMGHTYIVTDGYSGRFYNKSGPIDVYFPFDERNEIIFVMDGFEFDHLDYPENDILSLNLSFNPHFPQKPSQILRLGNGLSITVKIKEQQKYSQKEMPFIALDDSTVVGYKLGPDNGEVPVLLKKDEEYIYRTHGIWNSKGELIIEF